MYNVNNNSANNLSVKATTVFDLINRACHIYHDRIALVCDGEKLSYGEFARMSEQFACYLQQQGFTKGDVIALMMPNILAYPIALFSAAQLGLTVVNVNPMYTPPEVERVVSDSKASAIIVFESALETINKLTVRSALKCVICVNSGLVTDQGSGVLSDGVINFGAALNAGDGALIQMENAEADDIAFLQYTGGTTGTPKAAMLNHSNIISCVRQFQEMMPFVEPGKEVVLAPLPLYHIFGLVVCLLSNLSQGNCILLVTNPRDVPRMSDLFRKWPVTMMYGVSALYSGLYHSGNLHREDLSCLKFCVSGAISLSQDVSEKWLALSGCPIIEGYGMTETSGGISLYPDNRKTRFGTVGLPLPKSEISIRNVAGEILGSDAIGELCVKGPQVMVGYLNNSEETVKIFTADGFLRTGDIARIDDKGYIWIVDRAKDMINVSGFNVYPNEVEQVIDIFDGVLESACVGISDDKSGEIVKAFIVSENGKELATEQILAHCRNSLAAYKVPKHITYISSLPKSPVGKILRRELKESS